MNVEITTASSKGQIVLPAGLRHDLGIKQGVKFAVYGSGDTVVLKKLEMPSIEEFDRLTAKMTKLAAKSGIKPADVEGIIHRFRGVKE
jgi:AbrB family looped-hinge helix DNA binding protein